MTGPRERPEALIASLCFFVVVVLVGVDIVRGAGVL